MKIIVYKLAASEGGELTILKSYYERAKTDKKINGNLLLVLMSF